MSQIQTVHADTEGSHEDRIESVPDERWECIPSELLAYNSIAS